MARKKACLVKIDLNQIAVMQQNVKLVIVVAQQDSLKVVSPVQIKSTSIINLSVTLLKG